MPLRRIYIPVGVIPELKKHRFKLPDSGYDIFKDQKTHMTYYVFESEKGDIGAILSRYGIPREILPYLASLVQDRGGYVEDLYEDDISPLDNSRQPKPQQLAMEEIFRQAPYDETSHLTPDGKRKRR
ncbi:MAG: hypothetical protein QW350_00075 [Candidatus Aenigmatarchaeota archaeon]